MKTKMTKIMSLIVASAIVLSACGNTSDTDSSNQNRENIEVNTEGYPIVDETLTLKILKAKLQNNPQIPAFKKDAPSPPNEK